MAKEQERARNKGLSASPHTKGDAPQHRGGDAARKAQRWGGGNRPKKSELECEKLTTMHTAARSGVEAVS
jgi:hypothetical protein